MKEEKNVKVKYLDGSCNVIFTKMIEEEIPIDTKEYFVDEEEKVVCLSNEPVKMRDGIIIYADIYLPKTALKEPVPLIVCWSYLGKESYFESPDPFFWCYQGYAVSYVDPRGIGNSLGDQQFGTQEGRDGYDFIEWASKQKWCSGKVALFGNLSTLGSEYHIAEQEPPHLKAIFSHSAIDFYRNFMMEGGIPRNYNFELYGKGYVDNVDKMARKEPFITSPYWQDKIPKYEKIKVPVYMIGSWQDSYLNGLWNSFKSIKSDKKWIRCQESYLNVSLLQDLKLFFDRYLKCIHNGFELTPKVCVDVTDAFKYPYEINRCENEWPLARTHYKKLHLNASTKKLGDAAVKNESKVSYDKDNGLTTFEYTFRKDTELTGSMKLRLWVESKGQDDMDLFVAVKKLSTKGEYLPLAISDTGCFSEANGKLRVSYRHLDPEKSDEHNVVLAYDRCEKLEDKEIVPVDIEIGPLSRIWHKGQKIQLEISGHNTCYEWVETLDDVKGEHIIHTGGKYDSYLLVPEIPPRYEDGEYIHR